MPGRERNGITNLIRLTINETIILSSGAYDYVRFNILELTYIVSEDTSTAIHGWSMEHDSYSTNFRSKRQYEKQSLPCESSLRDRQGPFPL